MPRYYRRSYRRGYSSYSKGQKYSSETAAFQSTVEIENGATSTTYNKVVIPSSNFQGARKVKNFDLSIAFGATFDRPVFWALVYVPEGTSTSSLNISGGSSENPVPVSMYEPNQNVIMRGVIPMNSSNQYHFKSRLARILNSGDAVYMVYKVAQGNGTPPAGATAKLSFTLNYAIAF